MIEQGGERRRPSMPERIARGTARNFRDAVIIGSISTVLGGAAGHIPAKMVNERFRQATGFNAEENQAIRDRLRKIVEEKEKRGITKDPSSIPGRLSHFLERLFGEFKGDIAEWVKESEPILALRVQNVQLLEWVDWLTYYPLLGFIFLIVTPRIYRRIDNYVRSMRTRILEQRVEEHGTDIADVQRRLASLEQSSGELKNLEILAKVLMQQDADMTQLKPEQIKQLRDIIVRGAQIYESLPPEIKGEK